MNTWIPPSGRDAIGGCVWLPRMIAKARRIIETGAAHKRAGEYIFGENDPADAKVLRFLGVSDGDVLDVVRTLPDDYAAALHLLSMSGKTPEECAAFSRRFNRAMMPFLAMIEADEGRRKPGAGTAFLRWFYNRVLMPPAYTFFRLKER